MNYFCNFPLLSDRPIETYTDTEAFKYYGLKLKNYVEFLCGELYYPPGGDFSPHDDELVPDVS